MAPARAAERLNVVASFSILGDFVRNVGGDRVDDAASGAGRALVDPAHDRDRAPAAALAVSAGLWAVVLVAMR